jgi:hypothetical protein
MYAAKFGTDEQKMMEKLWGDNFFDPATRKWTKKATDSKTCVRGFVQFCYNPIRQVCARASGGETGAGVGWVLLRLMAARARRAGVARIPLPLPHSR